jgi:hypothetical protein
MDVDHGEEPILTIGTLDAFVMVGTLTILVISSDSGGITTTESSTGTITGAITIGTWAVKERGVVAAVKR